MSGFESLNTALSPVPAAVIDADKVAWPGQSMEDHDALGMVLADVQTAEAYVQSKNLVVNWEQADNNFRAMGLPRNWPGVESQRSGLSMPVVLEIVEKLMAVVYLAFFSDKQPFLLEAIGPANGDALRAKEKLLMWCVQLSGFKEEIRKTIKSCLLYGFGVARWGFKMGKISKKSYVKDENNLSKVKEIVKDYEIAHPTLENVSLRNFLFDPALYDPDVRKARYGVGQFFVDAAELDELRDNPDYQNVPTRDQLAKILSGAAKMETVDSLDGSKYWTWRDFQAANENIAQSVDPLKAPLEILEYVDCYGGTITVLQRQIVIRNAPNDFGRTTFLSAAFIDVPGSAYGLGVSKLLAGEQYLQTSVLNAWMDVVALILNPAFTADQGLQPSGQNVKVSPGRIITGMNIKSIPIPTVGAEALNVLQTSENRAARRVGANGADNMPTQALRTAEGVSAFTEGATEKLQYFVEVFADQVFTPALEAFLDVCHKKLQPADIQQILSEMDGKAYEGEMLDIYNAKCRVQILSSTKLAARRASAQLIPLLVQMVSAAPVQESLAAQGKKFNYAELIQEAVDLAHWDCDELIVPASQDDVQRAMMMANPGMVQAQSAQDMQKQKQQDALQQIEENGLMKAGVKVIDHALKQSGVEGQGGII
jgi:hypothetical protein